MPRIKQRKSKYMYTKIDCLNASYGRSAMVIGSVRSHYVSLRVKDWAHMNLKQAKNFSNWLQKAIVEIEAREEDQSRVYELRKKLRERDAKGKGEYQ